MIDRLWVRLVATLLAIELLLLPPLFIGLMLITERSHAELFTGQIRTYARLLADQFELGDGLESEARTARLLDSVILSGEGVYAELLEGPRRVRSGLMGEERLVFAGEDFEFPELDVAIVVCVFSEGLLVVGGGLLDLGPLLEEGVLAVDLLHLFGLEGVLELQLCDFGEFFVDVPDSLLETLEEGFILFVYDLNFVLLHLLRLWLLFF